ncbi:unnamed protein product [Cochlearia groenlandica]
MDPLCISQSNISFSSSSPKAPEYPLPQAKMAGELAKNHKHHVSQVVASKPCGRWIGYEPEPVVFGQVTSLRMLRNKIIFLTGYSFA